MYSATAAGTKSSIGSPAATRRRISVLLTSIAGISISCGCVSAGHSDASAARSGSGWPARWTTSGVASAKDLAWLFPARHVAQGVGADQEEQLGVWQLVVNLPQRVDGVALARRGRFPACRRATTGLVARLPRPQHFDPLGVGGVRAACLSGWTAVGVNQTSSSAACSLARAGQRQVAVVHGIETAAENAETHGSRGLGS